MKVRELIKILADQEPLATVMVPCESRYGGLWFAPLESIVYDCENNVIELYVEEEEE